MRLGLANASVPPAKRLIRYAPATPSIVLPMAIRRDVAIEPAVVTLTMNAPARMTGQMRYPKITNADSARPAGAHTAVALGFTSANARPNLPATT